MYQPKQTCRLQGNTGLSDIYGQPKPGPWINQQCAIVKLVATDKKTSVRADSSASRGNALELEAHSVILFGPRSPIAMDDVVEIAGLRLRVMGKQPRYSAGGTLDHFEVTLSIWSAA